MLHLLENAPKNENDGGGGGGGGSQSGPAAGGRADRLNAAGRAIAQKKDLWEAAEAGWTDLVRELLPDVLPNARDNESGTSPIWIAASNGHTDTVDEVHHWRHHARLGF